MLIKNLGGGWGKVMYRKKSEGWFKHYDFVLFDLICIQLAFTVSYMIRHDGTIPYGNPLYRNMALFLGLVDIIFIILFEGYKDILKRGYYLEFIAVIKQVMLIELFSVFYLFTLQKGDDYSRIVLYLTGIIYGVFTYIVRIIWKRCLKKGIRKFDRCSLILVTTSDIASKVIKNITKEEYGVYDITGLVIIDCDMRGQEIEGIPVIATESTASDYICQNWVDEVFVKVSSENKHPENLVEELLKMGVVVHVHLAKISYARGGKQLIEKMGDYTVLTTSINYTTARQAILKRSLDIIGGIVGCIVAGIIFVFIGPIIYISSPGPIIFTQTRVGKNGKKFKMYKFRSMYLDAEERKKELMAQNRVKDGRMFKVDFDTRVIGNRILPDGTKKTGIGNFIRVASLDEFPQFFNVLKGDMSLVGTRPPTVEEVEKYNLHHRARLSTKPGITGMWQISGRSDIVDFEEVVRLDTEYIENWSIGLDLKILFKTVGAVLKKKGSM